MLGRRFPKVKNREVLEEAPVFHPTEEEFSDTFAYIASLRERAEPCGICCVVPPSSWEPPCHLEGKKIWEHSVFSTQVQLFGGGIQTDNPEVMKEANWDDKNGDVSKKVQFCRIDIGPQYTLDKFKNFADAYKKQHFSMKDGVSGLKPEELSVADIEQEYTQLVENSNVELGVLYGSDLDTSVFGSGFTSSDASESCKFSKSGWNLNNTAKLPGSLLSFEDCESVSVPRLCVGMCFSTQFWKVEKDCLYSLCYLHLGAPRVWYAVPGHCSFLFKTTRERFIAEFSGEESEIHRETVMTMSPYALSMEGIPVTRCVQSSGQFVVIFPGSYYLSFDTGFNCLEKVNLAPLDWLPHGYAAVLINQEKWKKSLISYDKLLLAAARAAVRCQSESLLFRKNTSDSNMKWKDACGRDGILHRILKARVKQEKDRMEYLCNPLKSQKMDKNHNDEVRKRECCVCFSDLYLSAVRCPCSAERYSCLVHAKQLCPCPNNVKIFLYRYTIDDLNVLVEALEGKYSAMYRWARQDLDFIPSVVTHLDKKKPASTRKNAAAASIKAQVKARVKARLLERVMKVNEDKDVSSAAVSGGKTSERENTSRSNDDGRGEDGSSQLVKGCSSGKKNGEESSGKASLKKPSTAPSDSSASNKSKKQRQMR
ncbi:PREDICTED: probable inactive lysine-specific demethylase JMJ19 isoform X2 [Tarenaya hassleriana]|nr:PREDICTED: probable inactive lysine-specific demethylase JMJ19 isoform X2 [Tarenaya hassleriana]